MRMVIWINSRRLTFTSIGLVAVSVSLACAALIHNIARGINAAIGHKLMPWGSRGAPVQYADSTETLLYSLAALLAVGALTTGAFAIRRKEPLLRSLAFVMILLWVVWYLWSWTI